MAKATPDYTKMFSDMMGSFPRDMSAYEGAMKSSAALTEKMAKLTLDAADKSNQGTSINEATAKTMMTALGLAFVKVATAIETDEESPLDADSARALVVAIGDEYEETISQGAAAVDAEFTKVRSGSFVAYS